MEKRQSEFNQLKRDIKILLYYGDDMFYESSYASVIYIKCNGY
jgi:hypothetical protein